MVARWAVAKPRTCSWAKAMWSRSSSSSWSPAAAIAASSTMNDGGSQPSSCAE